MCAGADSREQPLPPPGSPWSQPSRGGSHLPRLLLHLPGHAAPGEVQVPPGHLQLLLHLLQPLSQVLLGLLKLQLLGAGLPVCAAEALELGLQLQEGDRRGAVRGQKPAALQDNRQPPRPLWGTGSRSPRPSLKQDWRGDWLHDLPAGGTLELPGGAGTGNCRNTLPSPAGPPLRPHPPSVCRELLVPQQVPPLQTESGLSTQWEAKPSNGPGPCTDPPPTLLPL